MMILAKIREESKYSFQFNCTFLHKSEIFYTPYVKNLRSDVRNLPVAFDVGISTITYQGEDCRKGRESFDAGEYPRSRAAVLVLSTAAVFTLPPATIFALPPATVVTLPPATIAALPSAAGSVIYSQRKGASLTATVINCCCRHTLLPLPQSPPPAAIALMANYIPPHQPQLRRPLGTSWGRRNTPAEGGVHIRRTSAIW